MPSPHGVGCAYVCRVLGRTYFAISMIHVLCSFGRLPPTSDAKNRRKPKIPKRVGIHAIQTFYTMNWLKTAFNVFVNAVKGQYFDFKGRTKMMDFWMFLVIYIIINVVLSIVDILLAALLGFTILSSLFQLAMLCPLLGIGARRMHDIGKSGWFLIIPLYNLYLWAQPGQKEANKWGNPVE